MSSVINIDSELTKVVSELTNFYRELANIDRDSPGLIGNCPMLTAKTKYVDPNMDMGQYALWS